MNEGKINLILNNNPVCETSLENVFKGEIWKKRNVPCVTVAGENFKDGEKNVAVYINSEKIFEEVVKVDKGIFTFIYELSNPIKNPVMATVLIDEKAYEIPIVMKRIFGTVKNYDGTPVKEPIISVTGEDIWSLCFKLL